LTGDGKGQDSKTPRQRKTSMRDAAVRVEMGKTCSPNGTIWDTSISNRDLGRPKTRYADVFKKTIGGRWTVDGGRWTVDGGRWTVDGGRWTRQARSRSSWRKTHRRLPATSGTYSSP
jgi:hypothetical protein